MLSLIASPAFRYLALIVAVLGFIATVYIKGHQDGVAGTLAKIAADNGRRLNNATRADTDAMRCALDPKCLWSDDGNKRPD